MSEHQSITRLREREREKYNNEYFAHHYWREDLPGLSGNRGLSYDDPKHGNRFRFISELIFRTASPSQFLDVGCGPGLLLENALRRGINGRGVDLAETARSIFVERLGEEWADRFDVAPLNRLPYPDRFCDLCTCLDVLEHLIIFDVFDAVRELCRVTSADLLCSINLDNPYEFHPTILSRNTWVALFESTGLVCYDNDRTEGLNQSFQSSYPEYDLFFFRRL